MRLLCLESNLELNTKVIANFLSFPTAIYTPSYNQWFNCYEFWKLTELLKFCSGQNKIPGQIWNLSLLPMGNWKYLEYRDHKAFPKLSNEA
jgi:hypothetical protein